MDPDTRERRWQELGLCGEVLYKTRDELSRMGVPWAIVKELPAVQKWSKEKTNRRRGDRWNVVEPIGFQNDIVRIFEAMPLLVRRGCRPGDALQVLHRGQDEGIFRVPLEPEPVSA